MSLPTDVSLICNPLLLLGLDISFKPFFAITSIETDDLSFFIKFLFSSIFSFVLVLVLVYSIGTHILSGKYSINTGQAVPVPDG